MIPSRATRAHVEIRIPWTLMQSTLSRRVKEKGHQVHAMGVLSAVVRIFNEIAKHAKAQASKRVAKANRASHGPRVSPHTQAKVRVGKTRENPKEPKVRTKVPKAYPRAKHRKLVSQVLKLEIGDKLGSSGICTDTYYGHFLGRWLDR